MIRNLKVLGLAAFALLAMSALAASAQAATVFNKPAEPILLTTTPDGTGKTAHQVFDAAGGTITCNILDGEATVAGTATTATSVTTTAGSLNYDTEKCNFVGQPATVNENGCTYTFYAAGSVDFECPGATKFITFALDAPLECDVKVFPKTGLTSIGYHNIKPGSVSEVTLEANVTGIHYEGTGKDCPKVGTFTDGQYTTGNTIITAEKDNANKEMVNVSVS